MQAMGHHKLLLVVDQTSSPPRMSKMKEYVQQVYRILMLLVLQVHFQGLLYFDVCGYSIHERSQIQDYIKSCYGCIPCSRWLQWGSMVRPSSSLKHVVVAGGRLSLNLTHVLNTSRNAHLRNSFISTKHWEGPRSSALTTSNTSRSAMPDGASLYFLNLCTAVSLDVHC